MVFLHVSNLTMNIAVRDKAPHASTCQRPNGSTAARELLSQRGSHLSLLAGCHAWSHPVWNDYGVIVVIQKAGWTTELCCGDWNDFSDFPLLWFEWIYTPESKLFISHHRSYTLMSTTQLSFLLLINLLNIF